MPTWGELLRVITDRVRKRDPHVLDSIRREYLAKLHRKTGRNVIIYATKWTQPSDVHPELLSITEEDIQGFMEVIHGLNGKDLDLIIHSPGGSAEATEALIHYLRSKFGNIRVIVPYSAMSAATMVACAGDKIILGKHSFLGPIDPQMIIPYQGMLQAVPAQSILDQFELAKSECKDPAYLGPWLPILSQYGPALLVECRDAIKLSQELVTKWLKSYMFKDKDDADSLSKEIAAKLSNHQYFKSHGRHICRDDAKKIGLQIEDLETDQEFQDLVLSIFHATTHTFDMSGAVKIVENHNGKAFIKMTKMEPLSLKGPPTKENKGAVQRFLDWIFKRFKKTTE